MAKKKGKKNGKVMEGRYDLVPLPADMYDKPIEWSYDPVVVECAHPHCTDICDEEKVLCDLHLYQLVGEVKTKAARDHKIRKAIANVASVDYA